MGACIPIQLTEHFTLQEMLVSRDFPKLVTMPPPEHQENLFLLCSFILEPLRAMFGPIIVTSGYRSEALNKKVGGVPTSRHLTGRAVDFVAPRCLSMRNMFEVITETMGYPGEVILYSWENRMHVGLPQLGRQSNRFIKHATV